MYTYIYIRKYSYLHVKLFMFLNLTIFPRIKTSFGEQTSLYHECIKFRLLNRKFLHLHVNCWSF